MSSSASRDCAQRVLEQLTIPRRIALQVCRLSDDCGIGRLEVVLDFVVAYLSKPRALLDDGISMCEWSVMTQVHNDSIHYILVSLRCTSDDIHVSGRMCKTARKVTTLTLRLRHVLAESISH